MARLRVCLFTVWFSSPSPSGRRAGMTTAWMQEVGQRRERLPRARCREVLIFVRTLKTNSNCEHADGTVLDPVDG